MHTGPLRLRCRSPFITSGPNDKRRIDFPTRRAHSPSSPDCSQCGSRSPSGLPRCSVAPALRAIAACRSPGASEPPTRVGCAVRHDRAGRRRASGVAPRVRADVGWLHLRHGAGPPSANWIEPPVVARCVAIRARFAQALSPAARCTDTRSCPTRRGSSLCQTATRMRQCETSRVPTSSDRNARVRRGPYAMSYYTMTLRRD
jgi:hypothetical protein